MLPRIYRQQMADELLGLMCLLAPGRSFTQEQIAAFVGASHNTIALIERSALAKFAQELERRGMSAEVLEHLRR